MAITACLKRNLQQNRAGCATIFGSRRRNWGEIHERVSRFAGGLKSLGLKTGDRVAVLALNSDRYLEYYIAVAWAGCVVVPLNIRWAVAEIVYALNDSSASLLLIDDKFLELAERIAAEVRSLHAIVHIGDGPAPPNTVGYERLIEISDAIPDAARDGEELAGIFYTGGTTGFSKGVMLPYRGLWASAMAGLKVHDIDRDSICLHTAPMFHLADFALIVGGLLAGATHAIVPAFDPEAVLAAIERYRVSHVLLVPTMIRMLVTHPKVGESDLSSLRMVFYGGSSIPEAVLIEAMRVLPNCRFNQAYGMTELSPIATLLTPDYHVLQGKKAGKLASAGRAALCCEVEIVNPDGVEVPRGVVGEVRVRGPNVMLGYWNKPEETAAALRAGWMYTGDAAYMDQEGFVYIVDRLKDMIVSGGENVYSAEVENAVAKHHAIAQCAVIGIPDEKWGEAVHAIVILKEGQRISAEEIIDHCRTFIAGYKCPRTVGFRSEPMPLSGAGKVLKRELRKTYWENHTRKAH